MDRRAPLVVGVGCCVAVVCLLGGATTSLRRPSESVDYVRKSTIYPDCLCLGACEKAKDTGHPLGNWCPVQTAPCIDHRGKVHLGESWGYCHKVTGKDNCVSHECANGMCVDGDDKYTCSCRPGWTGDHCKIKMHVVYDVVVKVADKGCLRFDPRDPKTCADRVGVDLPHMSDFRVRFVGEGGETGELRILGSDVMGLKPGKTKEFRLFAQDVGKLKSVNIRCYPKDGVLLDSLSVAKMGTKWMTAKMMVDGFSQDVVPLSNTALPAKTQPNKAVEKAHDKLITANSVTGAKTQTLKKGEAVWSSSHATFASVPDELSGASMLFMPHVVSDKFNLDAGVNGYAYAMIDTRDGKSGKYGDLLPAEGWTRRWDLRVGLSDRTNKLVVYQKQVKKADKVKLPKPNGHLEVIVAVKAFAVAKDDSAKCPTIDKGHGWKGLYSTKVTQPTAAKCQEYCTKQKGSCSFFSFSKSASECVLSTGFEERRIDPNLSSGYPCKE